MKKKNKYRLSTEEKLIRKADLVIADLASNGGLLNPEQSNRFYRKLIEQPTILNSARTVPMGSDTMKIPKIGIGNRVFHAATENTRLEEAKRTKPITTQIELTAKEIIAEIVLPYAVLEDNIEGEELTQTVLDQVAQQGSYDLEQLVLNGDRASEDEFLALFDGVLKRMTSNVLDANSLDIQASIFNRAFKLLKPKYRQNRASLGWVLTPDDEADWMEMLTHRHTPLGDAYVTGAVKPRIMGISTDTASAMPAHTSILTNPKNLIIGIRRRFTMESEKLISQRQLKFVLTARVCCQIEEEEATVRINNIGGTPDGDPDTAHNPVYTYEVPE